MSAFSIPAMKALSEYKLTRIAQDSIYILRKTNQFAGLQIQYETETKDKNIELLEQRDKMQQAQGSNYKSQALQLKQVE